MTDAYKVTLFFPIHDNEGEPFDRETWYWWFTEIKSLTEGFTDLGVVKGWWSGHSDTSLWIVLVVPTRGEVDRIRRFLRGARVIFRQKAMYLDYHKVFFEEVA